MRTLIKLFVGIAVLGTAAALAYEPALEYWRTRNTPRFKTAEVTAGPISFTVNSTGTIKPVQEVLVGSFVSGPIAEMFVDFNDKVTKGQLLATIDQRTYRAAVARDNANLATRLAEVDRIKARLQQAKNDEQRANKLRERNRNFISDSEMDQYHFAKLSLEAELNLAEAGVAQARATLETSQTNLEFTEIRSPVDGVIIDRKVDPGQTLAAQFQTPELFVVAPDMEKTMHVFASVDEADIGLIRQAKERGLPVRFSVDAYPDDVFEGTIYQVRASSSEVQNVVTYPVVIAAANPDLKLLPGMTANITFEVDVRNDAVRVPNAALRFFPTPDMVRSQDRRLVEPGQTTASAAYGDRARNRRLVWIVDDRLLRAVWVSVALADDRYSEITDGSLTAGQQVVVGIEESGELPAAP